MAPDNPYLQRKPKLDTLRETWVVREETRRSMRSNRSTGTKPEKTLRKALYQAGLRGYRKNDRRLPGTPDLYIPRARLAVFVHGCFWHGHQNCPAYRLPKTNTAFWKEKIQRNQDRHAKNLQDLHNLGLQTLTLWECQIFADLPTQIAQILAHPQTTPLNLKPKPKPKPKQQKKPRPAKTGQGTASPEPLT